MNTPFFFYTKDMRTAGDRTMQTEQSLEIEYSIHKEKPCTLCRFLSKCTYESSTKCLKKGKSSFRPVTK